MKTIYVFEGVERIGKTTLIKSLFSTIPYTYIASLYPIRQLIKTTNAMGSKALFGAISYLNSQIPQSIKSSKYPLIVIDRWFVSEWVYQFSWDVKSFIPQKRGVIVYLFIAPENMDYYVQNNTKNNAVQAYLNNRLFKLALKSYQDIGYEWELIQNHPLKKGVKLYKILT